MMLSTILWCLGGFILSEILYIFMCRTKTKEELLGDENNWLYAKLLSFVCGGGITGLIYFISRDWEVLLVFLQSLGIVILGIAVLWTFFYLNKKLGLKVAKK